MACEYQARKVKEPLAHLCLGTSAAYDVAMDKDEMMVRVADMESEEEIAIPIEHVPSIAYALQTINLESKNKPQA